MNPTGGCFRHHERRNEIASLDEVVLSLSGGWRKVRCRVTSELGVGMGWTAGVGSIARGPVPLARRKALPATDVIWLRGPIARCVQKGE